MRMRSVPQRVLVRMRGSAKRKLLLRRNLHLRGQLPLRPSVRLSRCEQVS